MCPSNQENTKSSEPASNGNKDSTEKEETYGYEHFPERTGSKYVVPFWKKAFLGEGRENLEKIKCEKKVVEVLKISPMVKLMLSALKNSQCEIDYRRHIACEMCNSAVNGGYDPVMNQIVICQNNCKSEGLIQSVLTHEMIHMYDNCRAEIDFKNIEHLACTEIRAANITHCSFLSAWTNGTASPLRIAKQHSECVKKKALSSILAVRNISREEAKKVVDKVFDKCYNDLSPVGRRIKRNSMDMHRAYRDRYLYGIYD